MKKRWFRLPRAVEDIGRDVDEELEFHISMRADELERSGLPSRAARARALEEFGDMKGARAELGAIDLEQVQRTNRLESWLSITQDLKFGWRSLYRQPGLTAVIVLTLGLGLGANATAFDLLDRLLYRPPEHVAAPERLQRLYFRSTNPWTGERIAAQTTYPDFIAFRSARSFEGIGAFMGTESTLGRGTEARKIQVGIASASFFTVLGTKPYIGRFYNEREDGPPHGAKQAVLSYEFWQNRLGGARAVLGQQLLIGNLQYEVIGVAPRGFTGADLKRMDVWVPVSVLAEEWGGSEWTSARNMAWLQLVGRLRAGVTPAQAAQELSIIWTTTDTVRASRDATSAAFLGPVHEARGPASDSHLKKSGQVATWLAGVSLLVLLVSCANVANLLLTRTIRRRRETGIRLALGVGRVRLLRQFLVESLWLATIAALVAIGFARWGGTLLRATVLPQVNLSASWLDRRLLLFMLVALLFTTLAMMLPPAAQMLRESIIPALKSGQRDGYGRSGLRSTLLFAQAFLSVVLLIGASLFVRSFHNVRNMDMGFDARSVLVADIDLDALDYTRDQKLEYYAQLRERISRLAGVQAAAYATTVPFYSMMQTELRAEGVDTIRVPSTGGPFITGVSADYFETTGIAILRGRAFNAQDRKGSAPVAIINKTMADGIWPGQDAIGKCLYVDDQPKVPVCTQVVGIAEPAKKNDISHDPVMEYYLPIEQRPMGMHALFVRARREAEKLIPAVQREMQTSAPNLPYADVRLMQRLIDPQMQSWKLGATLFSAFGVLALMVAAIGLYSMLTYAVASRTPEIGVRMALGARATDVTRLVVSDGLRIAAAGIIAGVAVALALGRRMGPLLFDVAATDPLSYGAASALLLGIALLAALIPARRATRVDPAVALKAE